MSLVIRDLQPHQVQTPEPSPQGLMMTRKNCMTQVIKSLPTSLALVALTVRVSLIKSSFHHLV